MKKNIKLLFLIISTIPFLVSCGNENSVDVSGSTSVAPLMKKIVEKYPNNKNVINVTADGTSAGIKAASSGISDIGMISRELEKNEKKLNLKSTTIALDAIGIIVNKDNGIKNVSILQLRKIFSGEIRNWKKIGGKDLPIVIVSREEGSGTKMAFEEIVKLLNADKSSKVNNTMPVVVNSTGAVIENVGQKEGAIGYVSLQSLTKLVKLIKVDSVLPVENNVKSKRYTIVRNYNIVTKDMNDKTKKFVDFILSGDGQKIVKDNGYVSIK